MEINKCFQSKPHLSCMCGSACNKKCEEMRGFIFLVNVGLVRKI